MLSSNNILKPSDGRPVAEPSQDMVLGCYFLTKAPAGLRGGGEERAADLDGGGGGGRAGARIAATFHTPVRYLVDDRETASAWENTTVGRVLFN